MGNRSNIQLDITSNSPEVTGSCIKIDIKIPNQNVKKILFDKGFFQETQYNNLNYEDNADYSDINYVFLSHTHIDHCGLLPTLYKKNYKGRIFCSTQSSKTLIFALKNVAKIMEHEAKENGKNKVLYTQEDVKRLQDNIDTFEYNKLFKLDNNISFMLIQNPHLYGASSIFLSVKSPNEETVNLLYVGDYSNNNLLFNTLPFPSWLYKKKINIIQEATYGNITTENIDIVFKENIAKATKENKAILLPAFSIGRYQEVMYLINLYKSKGIIPQDYDVYLDGVLPLDYNRVLFNDNTLKDYVKATLLKFPFIQVSNDPLTREKLLNNPKRCILITTSGMVSNGYSCEYVKHWLNHKNVLIHLLGYMAEGTLGRCLLESSKEEYITIKGEKIKKKAEVAFTMELSRHSKQDEQLEYLKPFIDIKCHITTHGNKDCKNVYANCVRKIIKPKSNVILDPGKKYKLCAYGLVKVCNC